MEENKPKYEVFVVNTAQYYTLHTKKYGLRKKWQPVDMNEVRSFIPGTILEVYVKVGQDVPAGDRLLKYEAMKMQTILEMLLRLLALLELVYLQESLLSLKVI